MAPRFELSLTCTHLSASHYEAVVVLGPNQCSFCFTFKYRRTFWGEPSSILLLMGVCLCPTLGEGYIRTFCWCMCSCPAMSEGRLVARHECEDKQPTPYVTPRPHQPSPFALFFAIAAAWAGVEGLDCFKCGSVNGSDPWCGDPFHHNHSAAYLASPCLAGWKGRQGAFPATHCIKLSGYFYETSEPMFVRGCTTDSGTLTVDTELGRQSHCGVFRYDGRLVVGCVEACNEFDGCNASPRLSTSPYLHLLLLLLLLHLFVLLLTVRVDSGPDL